ncbi:hypothetical protein PUN28_020527 [Cardiocondyla obscurior]|uniref:Uncharacterized protein n=1 Tax=Cardiocondyla obscurior TaxID=286306 RepID=A0AAW2E4I4_9HYME
MVRLVFRPYTQFRRSICTSESLRTSIRVSPDFVLTRHTSVYRGARLRRPRRTPACVSCGLIPCVYRRAAGRATEGLTACRVTGDASDTAPGRRPTPSGSRRSTRGEVHDDENAGHRRAAACPRASREAPRGIAHRREASVADDESPRSIFWVS